MATPDLPQLGGTPQIEGMDSNEAVASRVAAFGNIVQNFTDKGINVASEQVGLKKQATEMVLHTNITNAMRAFARSSTNQFDPKAGVVAFETQADEYMNKLMEGQTGVNAQVIKAYAINAKMTNLQPLEAAVVKQGVNEAKMNFLASVDSFQKDISQNISQVPLADAVSHHNAPDITKPKGQIAAGNIDLDKRPHVKRANGKISTVDSITIEEDGRFIVIPKVAPWGEVLSEKEAIDQYHEEYEHLGVFDNQADADKYAQDLHKSEEAKLKSGYVDDEGNPVAPPTQQKRIAPSIDSLQANLNKVLTNIDAAGRSGLISPKQAVKLKQQVMQTANDEMLYHKYQMAVEQGHGDAFITSYAKASQGREGAATFAKHIAEFKKIENRNLAQQAITESTARGFVKDNLKNLELGEPENTYADSLATSSPVLFPSYSHDKAVAQLSGGLYQQFTAGSETQALALFNYLSSKSKTLPNGDANKAVYDQALDTAIANAQTYFKELKADPQKFLMEKNLLGDVAQQQKIQEKNPIYLPDPLKVPMADVLEGSVAWQAIHGIPLAQASLMTNAQAKEFGGKMLSATPADKVKMVQSIRRQYGKYANNVMQQLIKQGAVPREYGFFTMIDPDSGALPDVVNAITNNQIKYDNDQKAAVSKRVSQAMSIATERAHPDVSNARRFLGMAYQSARELVTRREFDAAATNTGLFGTPALFPQTTTPDVKLKALTESYMSASGYNTGELTQTIDNTMNKLTNYYMTARGLSQDDAIAQSVRAITGQYEMVDFRDNIIRLPRQSVNYNDLSVLLANTPEMVNKIDWQLPLKGDYGSKASRTDEINYFTQNIENGHWATDPTDQGLVWVNANGMVNKMKNGNPLFVSFESMQGMKPIYHGFQDSEIATSYANSTFELFQKNNVAFNVDKFGLEKSKNPKLKDIPQSFSTFEKMTKFGTGRVQEFYDYLFEDMQERQRKATAKGNK
jgi:hypothetical protein